MPTEQQRESIGDAASALFLEIERTTAPSGEIKVTFDFSVNTEDPTMTSDIDISGPEYQSLVSDLKSALVGVGFKELTIAYVPTSDYDLIAIIL